MSNLDLPFGHNDGPRENWISKVQLMGNPDNNWNLIFSATDIEGFLRERMASVVFKEANVSGREQEVRFTYRFQPGWIVSETHGTLRLDPSPGASFEVLSYGMIFDLVEMLATQYPENKGIVVVFSEFRAVIHRAGMQRDEGITRLSEAVDVELSRRLFPLEWGSEDQL